MPRDATPAQANHQGVFGLKQPPATGQCRSALFLTGLLLLIAVSGVTADGGPRPSVESLSTDGQMRIGPSDRCPVCAMFPVRYPRTAAAMVLTGGTTFYFCSNGCLLRAWLRPTVYLARPREAIDRLVVRDYFSGGSIDAHTALWVAGSDVIGPMGPALIALEDAAGLAAFKKRHGAAIVFSLNQLDDALWQRISRHELPEVLSE
jgi:nitrous oxide reductase accessory protein NosL